MTAMGNRLYLCIEKNLADTKRVYIMSYMEQNSKTIYVVEDDVFLGKVISEQIREAHLNATQFFSGKEALDTILKKMPDLVLLDIFLPDMNGLQVLQEIRSHEETKALPVIVVSNTDEAKDRVLATELGAIFMIKAASSPDEIIAQVKQVLGIV